MNIQHPLLKKIDILSLDNIDSAVTKIKELGLNCKIHNDTIIVKYPKNLKYSKHDYILKSRGIIIDFTNKKILNHSIEGCSDYNYFKDNFNWDDIVIEECIDGTLINLYYNNKWCVSTKFCIDADESKFRNNKTFRQLFDSVAKDIYSYLDKSYTYSFLLQHIDCRNVTPITRNKIYHLESTNNVTGDKVQITLPDTLNPNVLKFGKYKELNKLNVNSFDELEEKVNELSWTKPGFMLYTKDRKYKCKLENLNYNNVNTLVSNQTNVNYIVIDAMYTKNNLPELIKYYPEFTKNAIDINQRMLTYTTKLHEFYIKCKVKNIYCELEKRYRKTLCDLHSLFKLEREQGNKKYRITFDIVCSLIRSYDTPFIYSLLF